jgi:AbiJ N-terminal domain 3/Abortive infection C-terminus
MNTSPEQSVSEVTRRNIADAVTLGNYSWSGRLTEAEFLARLYDIRSMPSDDRRYQTAAQDIWQHREMAQDWPDNWVFFDSRFDLLHAPDEAFLRFLCEILHPAVQPNPQYVRWALDVLNHNLAVDGWEIAPCGEISGKHVFAARRKLQGANFAVNQAQLVASALSASYISQQITRMENAVETDTELAIGTAKEFVETICKTVLSQSSVPLRGTEELPQIVRLTLKHLKLAPDDVSDGSQSAETIRVLLQNLYTITHKLSELRNLHGSGHGKDAAVNMLPVRHARLAVGAATAFGVFIFETHQSGQAGI